jgi:serine/threonine protein kinase
MIPGELVGEDYEIIKKIGEGSFGFVYKVRHKTTHELYAIKTDEKSVTKTEL